MQGVNGKYHDKFQPEEVVIIEVISLGLVVASDEVQQGPPVTPILSSAMSLL